MTGATQSGLSDLAEVTGRETTAALVEIATVIAAGKAASAITTAAPPFLRALFPGITAADLDRVARLLAWAMYCQHGATITALTRKLKTAKAVGADKTDALAPSKALIAFVVRALARSREEAKPTIKSES